MRHCGISQPLPPPLAPYSPCNYHMHISSLIVIHYYSLYSCLPRSQGGGGKAWYTQLAHVLTIRCILGNGYLCNIDVTMYVCARDPMMLASASTCHWGVHVRTKLTCWDVFGSATVFYNTTLHIRLLLAATRVDF